MDYDYQDLAPRENKRMNIIAGKYGETQFDSYKNQEKVLESFYNPPDGFTQYPTEKRKEQFTQYPTEKRRDHFTAYPTEKRGENFNLIGAYARSEGCNPCLTAKKVRFITNILILITALIFGITVCKILTKK